MADKDADLVLVQTLNNQLRDYKRKYEQAKTELRNNKGSILSQGYPVDALTGNLFTKATSQIFGGSRQAKVDLSRMPIAETGVISDIHVTTFQSSIDNLLSVAR